MLAGIFVSELSVLTECHPTKPPYGTKQVRPPSRTENAEYWHKFANLELQKAIESQRIEGVAKNVIFFVGDGLGLQTHTMSRIFKGQNKGQSGEEESLAWERFPWTGLAKTYNTDFQVPDSAGTATALFSGVKTGMGILGLDAATKYNVCDATTVERGRLETLADWGAMAGKEVGVVTTARITHATPAAMYASTANRLWEADTDMPEGTKCQDIATQLLKNENIKVIMGGGRRNFRMRGQGGRREDKDLVEEWTRKEDAAYLETTGDLNQWKYTDRVLGLFSNSHMDYHKARDTTDEGQPSLAEMTGKAITRLSRNKEGFVLVVEGARIDHAHHKNLAKRSMEETLGMEEAVEEALKMTNKNDTLIVVTADHSHSVTINGYPKRGNPITGLVYKTQPILNLYIKQNGSTLPYTTISYANGPGYEANIDPETGLWRNLTGVDYMADDFQPMTMFHADYETHGGEDVPVYALGPHAHLVSGVHEQSYLAHLIAYAACLKQDHVGCADVRGA